MSQLERCLTFMAIIEENSFIGAAKKLNISSAAVSKQMTVLEKQIGIQLLQRTTRRLKLTEAGELYYQQCQRIVKELEEAESLLSVMRSEPAGLLRIVSGRYIGEHMIIPYVAEFLLSYPKVTLDIELAERIPDIVTEKIDIAIGMSILIPGELIQRKIMTTRYVLCGSPTYLKQYGEPKKPSDLVNHRYITHTMRKPNHTISFKGDLKVHVKPFLYLNDVEAMLNCAFEDLGIIKVHEYVVAEALKKGELIEILTDYKEPEIPIYVCYPYTQYVQPKIRHFIDFILAKIEANL